MRHPRKPEIENDLPFRAAARPDFTNRSVAVHFRRPVTDVNGNLSVRAGGQDNLEPVESISLRQKARPVVVEIYRDAST
jgi:hypothetical protein